MACGRNRGFIEDYYRGNGNGYPYGSPCRCNGYYPYPYPNGNGYYPYPSPYPNGCYPYPNGNGHDDVVFDVHVEVPEHYRYY